MPLLSRVLVSDFDISYTIYKFRTQTPKLSQTSCSFCVDVILREMVYSNKIMKTGSFFWLRCGYIRHQNKRKYQKKLRQNEWPFIGLFVSVLMWFKEKFAKHFNNRSRTHKWPSCRFMQRHHGEKAEISLTEMSNLLSSQYPLWLVKKWLG